MTDEELAFIRNRLDRGPLDDSVSSGAYPLAKLLLAEVLRLRNDAVTGPLTRRMRRVADATRLNVIIGARGHKDDWFATVGDIEWDGSTPEEALESVVQELKQRQEARVFSARQEAEKMSAVNDL